MSDYKPIVLQKGNCSQLFNLSSVVSAAQFPLIDMKTNKPLPDKFNVYLKMSNGKELTFYGKESEMVWNILTAGALIFPVEEE